jgi:hypothetical protein
VLVRVMEAFPANAGLLARVRNLFG